MPGSQQQAMFTSPAVTTALVYTTRSLAALAIVTLLACSCKLLDCGVPGVVIVAQLLYLKCMHVLVETSIYVACYSHKGISTYVLLFIQFVMHHSLRMNPRMT